MGHREGAGRRVLRRRRARAARCGARSSRSATRSSRSSRSRARRRDAFAEMRGHFKRAHERCRTAVPAACRSSTRSAPARSCSSAVDTVFQQPAAHAGLTADPGADRARGGAAGRAGPGRALAAGRARRADRRRAMGCAVRHESETSRGSSWRGRSPPRSRLDRSRRPGRRWRQAPRCARRHADSGAAARRAVRGDHPRAEERRRPGRRRRPAGADRAHRGDGPDGAGRRAAAAGGRSGAGDGAEEPAVRAIDEEELFELAWDREGSLRAALRAQRPDLAARLDALGEAGAAPDAVRVLRRPARRRRRPQGSSWRGSAPRPTTRSTNSSISRSTTSAARRRRCRASSRGCAPRRPRSSATWRWRATRCG